MRYRLKPRRFALVGLFLSALMLAACGSEKRTDVPSNLVITIRPRPVATVLPGCVTIELSDWYEVAGTLIGTFRAESGAALDRAPDEMGPVIQRLIDLRDAIANQPVPECALQAHGEVVATTQEMLTAIQRYVNGDLNGDELEEQIAAGSARIETDVANLLASVRDTLDDQNRRERQTPQATAEPGPTSGS
jgi:hypothetical protein